MSGTITIRHIAPQDWNVWRELWTAYLHFYESDVSDAVYDATFERLCSDDHPDQNGFLAFLDNTPVGLVHYIYHPHNWKLEKTCYLQDLFTAPEARRQGVGRKLIEMVYAAADTDGCPSVYWLTQKNNTTARQLYDDVAHVTPFIKYAR